MRRYFALLAISASIAAACSPSLPSSRPLGVINLKDTTDDAGGYVFKPTGVFFQASNVQVPNSTIAPDTCIDAPYVPPVDTLSHLLNQNLDAGSPVQVSTSTAIGTMTPDTVPNIIIIYRSLGFISHVPGTDVTYNVPGAPGGFSSAVIHGQTPKQLALGPIDPQPADSLHLTWNADRPGLSAVNINLIYASTNGSSKLDAQILCALLDDGDFYLSKKQSAAWKLGFVNGNQKVTALRYITSFESLANSGLMVAISEFDTTKTSFP